MFAKAAGRLLLPAVIVALAACVEAQPQRVFLPQGDAVAGKESARTMQCYACHEIAGSEFPAPHAQLRGAAPALGAAQAQWSRDSVATVILAPSHERAEGQMGDYREAMTVRQLIDIVAYLQSLGQ
jgi:cytochrome c2